MSTVEQSFANFLEINKKMTDECPICMDAIDPNKNRVTTECGHTFHCSCLMTNVSHNGFACPYCRTAMAEEVEGEHEYNDDYSTSSWYYGPSDDDSVDDSSVSVAGPGLEAHVLRGMRWLFQRVDPQEDDDDSVWETDDDEDSVWETDDDEEEVEAFIEAEEDYHIGDY